MATSIIDINKQKIKGCKANYKRRFPKENPYTIKFLDDLSSGEINKGKFVGSRRQIKYLNMLMIFLDNISKPVDKITKPDMKEFIKKLTEDVILKKNGKPYAEATKQDIKVNLRVYLKWRLPKRYVELTDWIDYKCGKKTPEILKEEEIEKLYKACVNNEQRFLIAVLFDSGARASEFLNIRFEDVEEPTKDFPYYKITLKEEYSKTEGRTIGLYWKHSTEAVREYLKEKEVKNIEDPVFPKDYDAVRMFITRLGKRILNKRVHLHKFRKSSATHYASKLKNRQQLCNRYGWKYSSYMPDLYIKRSGMIEEDIKEKMQNTDMEKLEKKNREMEFQIAELKEKEKKNIEYKKLQEEDIKELRKSFEQIKMFIKNK